MNNHSKNFQTILSLVIISFVSYFALCFKNVRNQSTEFNLTKLDTSIDKIEEEWGEPDHIVAGNDVNNSIVLFYEKDIFSRYYFEFDKDTKKLIQKGMDE